ncbi:MULTISPECIES: CdaR family protein [Ruminococcus]|jgi:YbbR domain-containing protein|uniref:CdaR family protein n=1 Tax=Ruminococcus TaxID=1263 RepID=UPI0015A29BCC|nr:MULTISPECIES: CdaR family protein [Ruminococcus]
MKKKKFSLNKLFQNNKFLIVLALVISSITWVYMSMGTTNDTSVTISNIPIQIELPDQLVNNGLQVFSDTEQTATVTVTGSRAVLGSISTKDITVTAATNGIDSAGTYQISLSAVKTNPSANFQIISTVTPSNVNVIVDYLRETSFPIQENVVYKVADGYYASTSLASKNITISGPQTEIAKIAKVSASAELDGTLDDSTSTTANIILYDKSGNKISTDLLKMEFDTVEASISVLPEKTVKVVPEFVNKPDGLDLSDNMLSVEPSKILLAGPKNVLDSTDSVKLESIDFATLSNKRYEYDAQGINIPTDCKNISNSTAAKLILDLSDLSKKTFTVDSFKVSGLSSKYKADVTQTNMSVTVIGSEKELKDLKSSDIECVIDTSDQSGTVGSVQMPVTFKLKGTSTCWVSGSYKANITISEK